MEFCSVPCMNTPTLFTFFPLRHSPSTLSSLLLCLCLQTFGQFVLQDEFGFFNASICECFLSFVFVCVWPSGLTPTFNSCGKCSQTFHFQVPLSFPTPTLPLSVSLLAFLSPSLSFSFPSVSPTHTHAGTWCTHLRLDIHSLLLLHLTWEP